MESAFVCGQRLFWAHWRGKGYEAEEQEIRKLKSKFRHVRIVPTLVFNSLSYHLFVFTLLYAAGVSSKTLKLIVLKVLLPSLVVSLAFYRRKFSQLSLSLHDLESYIYNWIHILQLCAVSWSHTFVLMALCNVFFPSSSSVSFPVEVYEEYLLKIIPFFWGGTVLLLLTIRWWKRGLELNQKLMHREKNQTLSYVDLSWEIVYQGALGHSFVYATTAVALILPFKFRISHLILAAIEFLLINKVRILLAFFF
jgi:hypothetical protein